MSSEELKPCPFCLREAQQTASSGLVSCAYEDCPAFLLAVPAADWNRRAQLAAIQQAKGDEVEDWGWLANLELAVVQCCCPWNPDGHDKSCPVYLRDRLSDAKRAIAQHQRITAAMAAEVERLSHMLNNATNDGIKLADERDALRRRTWLIVATP